MLICRPSSPREMSRHMQRAPHYAADDAEKAWRLPSRSSGDSAVRYRRHAIGCLHLTEEQRKTATMKGTHTLRKAEDG